MFHPAGPTFWELAQQCLSSTEHGYDLLAPKFDFTPFRTPDEILDRLATLLGPPRSIDAALDVCCGTGAAIRILRPLCRQKVVGIDFSRGMLAEAGRRWPDQSSDPLAHSPPLPLSPSPQPPVELIHRGILTMNFQEEFDLALTVGSLGHILQRDQPRFVERIAAALKPGGRFVFLTTDMPPCWSRQYVMSRAFNAAMRVRNLIKRPPFVMFYLTFVLPQARILLEQQGFDVKVHDQIFAGRWRILKGVVGVKRGG